MDRFWLLVFLGGFVFSGVQEVLGIEIKTKKELEAVNGTNVRLWCSFTSTQPILPEKVIVSWSFRGINSRSDDRVLYYHEIPYPQKEGLFKGHAVWSGDIGRKDASITLNDVQPNFNGTYTCHVTNPPDFHGSSGQTVLRVVNKVTLSDATFFLSIVGGCCGLVLVLLGIFAVVKVCRKKQREDDFEYQEECSKNEPTICSPAEAVHLTVLKKEKEVGSSDDEESEPSSGGDEEEDDPGDGDDDDDDEDDDDGGDDEDKKKILF
ncbi:PREDICTED: myelin protein zero-like protein 2 [Cyprinodon variegatus]|uniref:Myelin protein zero-like protein 2 n=1 Tax=Cyprinodon variegatus TaxID=28743 RepID=A0A3Q2EIB4_CYPVA|nr:PREDICTED: myelin protein zero-like protein 2 [Cyprinodon variegatus]